ncbi:MAG: family oxidoreductase [Moraxellaceae bacterium]|jgi:choline dehydrogenase-like flavoprotein|nr:family oxidoreductase [Moraxellaceae bacterium]
MIEVKGIQDFFAEGVQQGWRAQNAGQLQKNETVECDVVIVGTGAGGGTTAEILTQAGLDVVLIEEGPLRTSGDFRADEFRAYRDLYQEGGGRTTKDGSMTILQGRSVGGSTTINWTSSFRTPPLTLKHWADVHGVKGVGEAEMKPWFERAEQRLNITPWEVPPNPNNTVLKAGCEKLGWSWATIPRNVVGCWNLGYCGMGCPTNAKQSMLVTTIPEALKKGARLYYRARAEKVLLQNGKAVGVECHGMREDGVGKSGTTVTVKARHVVVAGGGINSPGLLLRSQAPDPHRTLGTRTFLHPVNVVFAQFADDVLPWSGAPQSAYSDHFQWKDGATGPMGFKLEALPLHPALASSLIEGFGAPHAEEMRRLKNTNGLLALQRDGFVEDSPGGTVSLRDDGVPTVDYPLTEALRDGLRRSFLAMAEIQFAAGAKAVRPKQLGAQYFSSWATCREAINAFSIEKFRTGMGSAHVMGGCAMGEDAKRSVVDSQGRYHHLEGLSVLDGSIFPTSIGANPQLSIYGLVTRLATQLAGELKPAIATSAA